MNEARNPLSVTGKLPPWLLLVLPLAFLGLFFYTPLVMIFQRMLDVIVTDGLGGINASRTIWRAFRFTVWQAALSTALTLLLGLPAAYLFARFRFPGKRLFSVLFLLPFILPTVVVATAFTATLGTGGWVNQLLMSIFRLEQAPLNLLNSLWAILLVHVFYNVAIVIRVVGASWSQLDQSTTHAARVLGASPLRTFGEVTLPLLRPSILAAALLVFLFDFASFGVILMLGGPQFATLEVEIFIQAMNLLNLPLAAVLSAVQLVSTLVLMLLYQGLQRGEPVALLPRVNNEGTRKPRTVWQRLFVNAMLISLLVFLTVPLLTLVLRSVQYTPRGGEEAVWTFQFYQELFINRRGSFFYVPPIEAVKNSLIYALITMGFSLVLGFQIAYAFERHTAWSGWLETAVMLPLGSSPITLGLGYLLIFSRPPWSGLDFPILIPIAHTLVALPMVVRTLQPALRSIPRSLRDSAGVLGASPVQRWLHIDLPILSKAALTAGIFAFTVSLGEFGATSFLSRPENPTLPTAIFRFFAQPGSLNFGQAMAMSVILLAICGASIFAIELLEK